MCGDEIKQSLDLSSILETLWNESKFRTDGLGRRGTWRVADLQRVDLAVQGVSFAWRF